MGVGTYPDRQQDRSGISPLEQRLPSIAMLGVDRFHDGAECLSRTRFADTLQHIAGLVQASDRSQPACTLRNPEQAKEKAHRGDAQHAKLPAPLGGP